MATCRGVHGSRLQQSSVACEQPCRRLAPRAAPGGAALAAARQHACFNARACGACCTTAALHIAARCRPTAVSTRCRCCSWHACSTRPDPRHTRNGRRTARNRMFRASAFFLRSAWPFVAAVRRCFMTAMTVTVGTTLYRCPWPDMAPALCAASKQGALQADAVLGYVVRARLLSGGSQRIMGRRCQTCSRPARGRRWRSEPRRNLYSVRTRLSSSKLWQQLSKRRQEAGQECWTSFATGELACMCRL